MKFTQYFLSMRQHPDRRAIRLEWDQRVVEFTVRQVIQADGRIRRWGPVEEMDGKYLHGVLLLDSETVHNAYFDNSFKS